MKNPIKHCKICFKLIKSPDLYEIINGDSCVCGLCQQRLKPIFKKFEIDGVNGLAIYEYDDNIKALLYQFKGCYDIELANVFLNRFKRELNLRYHGYTLIPAPSYHVDDEKRQFKHVEEIYKCLNLPIVYAVEKITPFKQAEHTRKQRVDIYKHLSLVNKQAITNKKILIVDDVSTTGATMKAMIRLIKDAKPKTLQVLVMSKRIIK